MNLRAVRERKGLTREQVAERAGISLWTIRAIEVRDAVPKATTLRALAKALGVPVEKLISAY